jgi:hypothetical protein
MAVPRLETVGTHPWAAEAQARRPHHIAPKHLQSRTLEHGRITLAPVPHGKMSQRAPVTAPP